MFLKGQATKNTNTVIRVTIITEISLVRLYPYFQSKSHPKNLVSFMNLWPIKFVPRLRGTDQILHNFHSVMATVKKKRYG